VARQAGARRIAAALVLVVGLLSGCSMTPGRGLTLFPEEHRLLESAKAIRQASPTPLPLPRELDKQVQAPYVVEPGDVLLVHTADLDSPVHLPGDQPVLPDGTINLGRYGRVLVAGHTVDEIEGLVRGVIEAQTKNAGPVLVRVVTRVSKVYYVLGEVNAPGSFTLSGRETALDGIIAAGGLTDRASRHNIILSRPTPPGSCRLVLPVCYSEIVQLGDTSTNYQLAPGDRIFVPSRSFWDAHGHDKKDCGPCGGPQVPCPDVTHSHSSGPVGPLGEMVPQYNRAPSPPTPLPQGARGEAQAATP
jgi:protein involved in polysaccharide export with SLBB domain